MNVLLLEPNVKSIAPNVALLKLARYCEIKGYPYQYVHGKIKPKIAPDVIYTSCVFSYYSEKYKSIFKFYQKLFPGVQIVAGGGFPTVNPEWFHEQGVYPYQGLCPNFEQLIPKYDVPIRFHKGKKPYERNKILIHSSKGCVNKCSFCLVPKLEGRMKSYKSISNVLRTANEELPGATSIVLYDSNFTEQRHFSRIVDELKEFGKAVDVFGLHVDSFTEKQAKKLRGVKFDSYIRFSFDQVKYADGVEKAFRLVRKHEIKASFFCYLLYNFNDSPSDFWNRLQIAQEIRDRQGGIIFLFPQRYEPLNALNRNQYVSPKWTPEMLHGLAKLYTYIHGFLPITESRNVFNWIGHTKEEFFENVLHMDKHAEPLTKKGGTITTG